MSLSHKLRVASQLLANSHILDKMSDHMRELYVAMRSMYPLAKVVPFDDDRIEIDYKGDSLIITSAGKDKYRCKGKLCARPRDVLYVLDGYYDKK